MKAPTTLKEIHYKIFLELLEIKEYGPRWAQFIPVEEKKIFKAVENLLKGRIKVLGYYDAYESDRKDMRIQQFFRGRSKVYKFLYELPSEDGYHLVASRVLLDWPWRVKE